MNVGGSRSFFDPSPFSPPLFSRARRRCFASRFVCSFAGAPCPRTSVGASGLSPGASFGTRTYTVVLNFAPTLTRFALPSSQSPFAVVYSIPCALPLSSVCTVNASAKPDEATHFAGTDAMTYEPSLALTMLLGTRTLYTPSLAMSAFSASVSSRPNGARVARGELKRKFLASFLSTASLPVTTPAGANVDSSSECSTANVISSPPRRAPSRANARGSDAKTPSRDGRSRLESSNAASARV